MADGRKTLADFESLFDGEGTRIALQLIQEGFLIEEKTVSKVAERTRTQIRMSAATGSPVIQQDERARHPKSQLA
ncbi:MAG: hypothetical protein CFE44_05660 [Burkholderiales bacterium PBB4]|nr:MAG: hypothetical protein CFE44_05660 [Burkholderiales bacterium PBB4]